LIASKIQRDDEIEPAYKLIDIKTGRSLKYPVTPARIKKYNENRLQFEAVNPPLQQKNSDQLTSDAKLMNGQIGSPTAKQPELGDNNGFVPAIRINRQRITKSKQEYLVLFKDGSQYWCDGVTQSLLDIFRMRQQRSRDKQRRKKSALK